MGLRQKVDGSLKQAMRDKDKLRLSTLRLINAAIKDKEIAMRGADDSQVVPMDDDEVRRILARMVKQRRESARAYEEGGRIELAEQEHAEIGVIEEFLPRPMDEAEQQDAIDKAVSELDAGSIRDMGRVMALLKDRHTGQMDFAAVGPVVKQRLGG
jgi:uncharacterized protein YqeY